MASEKSEDSKFPVAGVLILVAVIGGFWFYQQPYKSDRPVKEHHGKPLVFGDKRVQSRLWQDPFTSLKAHKNVEEKSNQSRTKAISLHALRLLPLKPPLNQPGTLPLQVEGFINTPEAGSHHDLRLQLREIADAIGEPLPKFKILIVVTEGTPYASGTEYRLRHRYAVVSALGVADYFPEGAEFFRYFSWNRKNLQDQDICWNESCPPLDVPFEWFKPSVIGKDHVLVLWVKDQDLDKKPLTSLESLVSFVKNPISNSSEGTTNENSSPFPMSFKVLGPFHSGTLRAMVNEVIAKKDLCFPPKKSAKDSTGIQYLSYSATAADTVLLEKIKTALDKCSEAAPSRKYEKSWEYWGHIKSLGFDVHRVIGTDEGLARELVKELERRRVYLKMESIKESQKGNEDPDKEEDQIALIGEWDTLYGRNLPLTFVGVTRINEDSDLQTKIKEFKVPIWPEWAHRYSYLRGLDGELPQNMDPSQGTAEGSGTDFGNFLGTNPKDLAAPEGPAQLDYLRRLAAQIKEEDRKIHKDCINAINKLKWKFWEIIGDWQNCRGFKAMGILAGDVYDKLLLLQALKKEFPGVIFFTTDLDTRLLHPSDYQWTRNLLIGSHFGLLLDKRVQRSIPPFRDGYQTSLFLSALLAIDHVKKCRGAPPVLGKEACDNPQDPSSYEIPARIFEVGRTGAYDLSPKHSTIHVPRPDFKNETPVPLISLRGFILLGCIFLSSWVIYFSISRKGVLQAQAASKDLYFWAFLLGIVSISFWLYVSIHNQMREEEPFAWLEGISVWPTEWLRLGAFFLSLLFLCRGYRLLQAKFREIEAEFHLKPEKCSGFLELKKWIGFGSDISGNRVPSKVFVSDCWRTYTSLQEKWCVGIRVLIQTFFYLFLFGLPVFFLIGFPTTPCRGTSCFAWNFGILLLSVVTLWLLIFFVVYTTRLCGRMVGLVLGVGTQWPSPHTVRNFRFPSSANNSEANIQQSLRFCGQLTEGVGKLIYYPFIVVLVMIVSRSSFFDGWDFPISLLIVIGSNIGLAIFTAFHFRQSAEKARRRVLQELESMMNAFSGSTRKAQVQQVIRDVQNFKKGAFCPFAEQPILKAFAIPSGGYFLMILIEYLGN